MYERQGSGGGVRRSVLGVPAGRDPAAEESHYSAVLLLEVGGGGGKSHSRVALYWGLLLGSPATGALTAVESLYRRSRSPEVALGGRATGGLAAGGGHIWSNGCYASQHQASHLSGFFGPRRFLLEVWTI